MSSADHPKYRFPAMSFQVTNILAADVVIEHAEVDRTIYLKMTPAMWDLMVARVESERKSKLSDELIVVRVDGRAKNI